MAEETAQNKTALASANANANANGEIVEGGWPYVDGVPMMKVTCAAAELIPTVQYGNVTIGPCQVTFFASPDGEKVCFTPEGAKRVMSLAQSAVEASVAEERQTVQAFMRSRVDR